MVNRPILCVFLKASADVYNDRNFLLSCEQSIDGIAVERTDYTYDVAGNRLTETKTTYAVATESGKDETTTVLTNTFDLRNQLIKSVTEDAVINNTYNAAGYRVGKSVTENGKTSKTYFLYDGNSVIMEADEDGVTAKNTYGGPLLLRTVFEDEGETTYQYMYNAHGDVVTLLTDGAVVATYYYDSFGNILDQTGEVSNSILYAGYQYDVESGLYYINARMYDPVTARFLQADTYLGNLNDPLSLNLYTYCLNNPHKYVDPSGHSVLLAFLLVTAVSFVVGAGMEYINQKYIEQRDVINYDLIFFEGAFNAVIAAVSFGTANLGVAAARQSLRLTARTATQAVGRSMAFGAMEGATEEIGRQLVEGKTFSEIDYGQVAFSATINGITGGFGGYSGAKKEAFDYARQATKGNVRKYANALDGKKYSELEIKKILDDLQGGGFKNNPLRLEYENEVAKLKIYGEELLGKEMSEEQVARRLNQARRDLGIKYKNATPQPLRDYIYEVNLARYDDKLGPTYEWLITEKGATNRQIIESASRPNSNIDRLLSGFEDWLRRQ